MLHRGPIFPVHGSQDPWWMKKTILGGLLAVVTIVIYSLTIGFGTGSFSREAVMEARIKQLEQMVAKTQLDIAQQVQRTLADEVSQMLTAPSLAGKTHPPTVLLPSGLRKRILVTGGAGFVGSHLVDVLMTQGHYVYVLDNLFTGRLDNIKHWMGHPNFQFFQHDVVEPFLVEVDQIYHLACPASPPHYQYNMIKTVKTSAIGTMNMLGLAKRTKARLLFTSTSEVYGDPEIHPQPETYWGNVNTMGPRSCYDEGKRVAETMCYSYEREEGVEVRVARIFNTFGPRMHPNDGRVVSNFIIQALQGKPLTIYGKGEQTRSFQYVADLVSGLVKLMNSDYSRPVNIGNPDEYTIRDFAEKIRAQINPEVKIEHLPPTQDDPQKRKPDISLAKKVMNWSPQVTVDEGLYYAIQYFSEELSLPLHAEARKPESSWTHHDSSPLWVASVVNDILTDKEKGLLMPEDYSITPKAPL